EPTIGLDVVAQHKIQKFLRHYQEIHKVTILLTSHYMKDVAALCKRVVIIANGSIMYDGSLAGIIDRFSGQKIVTLLFAQDAMPRDLTRHGEVLEVAAPKAKLRIDRRAVADVLVNILQQYAIEDVSVEDPPLEEVFAKVFSLAETDAATSAAAEIRDNLSHPPNEQTNP
ncbi:MAG: ABC transporter, partial [Pirellulales bacterium]